VWQSLNLLKFSMELNSIAELLGRGLIYWGLKKKLEETPILPFVGGWFECKATALSLCFFLISIHFISKKNCCCQRKTTVLVIWQSLQNQSLTIKSTAKFIYLFIYLYLDWTNKMKKQESNKKSQGSGGQTPTRFQNPTHGVQIKPRAHDTCKWL
jgi:hypothetical protein